MMGSKEIFEPWSWWSNLTINVRLTWQNVMMMSNVFNQCTMYWNDTQSLSMFLQTQLMSILTLSSNKPLITLHSFLTWGNKACNINVTVTSTQLIYYYKPWWFTWDPNDELINCWLPWGDCQWDSFAWAQVWSRLRWLGLVLDEDPLPPVYITVN